MKLVQLIHNPGAGDEKHSRDDLTEMLEAEGYECTYLSTKIKGWKDFDTHADILLVAGGDGTVRKVAEEVLEGRLLDRPGPIALLPLGTANNISRALGLTGEAEDIIRSWKDCHTRKFDVGRIYHIPNHRFFLESFGYGIFPYLMQEMKKRSDEDFGSPEEKIQKALEVLLEIVLSYEPRHCQLEVDGTDHSGKFILAEIMNIPSIGPNLHISPLSDPSDGEFEVVLVPEQHKDKFAAYVEGRIQGNTEATFAFHTLKGRSIRISWTGTHVHVDDQIVKLEKKAPVQVQVKSQLLEFLVTEGKF